jgi:hypothetical protein
MIEAQCRCGAIGLKIAGEPVLQLYYHCDDARPVMAQSMSQRQFIPHTQWKLSGKACPDGGQGYSADALRGLRRVSIF